MFPANRYAIRLAGDGDEAALDRLAQLDSAAPLEHPILVGEIGDRVAAALDLDTGRAIADPFVPTANLLAHLRVRAAGFEASVRTPDVSKRLLAALSPAVRAAAAGVR
jgi:hypothetical protein